MSNIENNKRIAKNTFVLYLRMMFTILVSLYASRVVLNVLGVEDFGIYNVVGGIVTLFSFLSTAMSAATQRFLSYEIGRKDFLQLRKTFSTSVNIHVIIAILILILSETLGLWFLNNKMVIPVDRMHSARWVFHFTTITFVFTILRVPYNAIIIAREKMKVYAYLSVIEASLKLIVVYLLLLMSFDKLILYSLLIFLLTFLISFYYFAYCNLKFSESKYYFCWDKKLLKVLTSFSSWSLFGTLSWVFMNQGLNLVLNLFFGPSVNASRGIAFQVNGVVTNFVSNFRLAISPQIIKSHSEGDTEYRNNLVFEGAKYSFYLMLLICLPIYLEIDLVLKFWLKIVPEYSALFCQLILVNTLIHSIDIGIVFSASGNIKENQFYGGLIYMLVLPISYYLLSLGFLPQTIFYVQIIATLAVNLILNAYLLNKVVLISPHYYYYKFIIPVLKVFLVSVIVPLLFKTLVTDLIYGELYTIVISITSVLSTIYFIGIDNNTKLLIKNKINSFVN